MYEFIKDKIEDLKWQIEYFTKSLQEAIEVLKILEKSEKERGDEACNL